MVFFQLQLRAVSVHVLGLEEATARGLENWKLIDLLGTTQFLIELRRVFNKPQ